LVTLSPPALPADNTIGQQEGLDRVRRNTGQRGTALVEFALLLPFLAIVVFGTIDLGRAYLLWNQVKNSAREGANYAQLHPSEQTPNSGSCADPANIRYRARSEAGSASSNFTVTVSPAASGGCDPTNPPAAGTNVTVTVGSSLNLLTPLVAQIVGNPLSVKASVTVVSQRTTL
jgi:Flp pilus assembly protein TadG